MKPYLAIIALLLLLRLHASSQNYSHYGTGKDDLILSKPCIDSHAIDTWPFFGDYPRISNDGIFFKYNYSKGAENENILVIANTSNNWKLEFPGADYTTGFFSSDNKTFYLKIKDTLFFLDLKTKRLQKIENVLNLKVPNKNEGEWIAYQLEGEEKRVFAYNLVSKNHVQFESVEDYYFNSNGSALLLKITTIKEDLATTSLKWISLPPCKIVNVYECSYPANTKNKSITAITFSPSGYQIAFIVKTIDTTNGIELINRTFVDHSPTNNELWYYASDMEAAVLKACNHSETLPKDLFIHSFNPMFSKDGKFIYFNLYKPFRLKEKPTGVMVDVWNYQDTLLQCTQLEEPYAYRFMAVMGTNSYDIIQLTHNFESIRTYAEKQPYVVINYNIMDDRFWLNTPDTNWLVSLQDGFRKRLPSGFKQFSFSPDGKYLLFYDYSDYNYYSYDLATEKITNISSDIQPGVLAFKREFYRDYPTSFSYPPIGIAAWTESDSSLLVYDQYDIWRLDPSGKHRSINVTNGYGRANHIQFRLTYGMVGSYNPIVINSGEPILLTAFNTENKHNGFYTTTLQKPSRPRLLTMGPYVYDLTSHNQLPLNAQNFNTGYGMAPIKAKHRRVWITKRQSITEAPNYFLTADLKTYLPLTNYQPHKYFNWLSAELVKWPQLDGTITQGILYKPENFDSTRKYPVIFNYYQQRSHRLHQFPSPSYTIANIDVAWFVSRGYLVFTPDIYFTYGQPGPSALNTMVSAADFLAKLPYVDQNKLGINGHSVGGGLTNYLITHTDKFAAAIECAGVSNTISSALQLGGENNEVSRMEGAEFAMGNVSIWKNPQKYLDASAIMNANKVVTPLLIMHNKTDGGVPWAQALELFLALRRLEKPVWMLQYDKGNHSLWGTKEEAKDFTIRITQFFDHYLKGLPAPKWMVNGIPAKMKGIDPGFELVEGTNK